MILFLPPAPYTGQFFDYIRGELSNLKTTAATYPGYGDVPASETAAIENYAKSLLPQKKGTQLIGFHTGCLVALEMAFLQPALGPLILIDIPLFDNAAKTKHRAALDPENTNHNAFFAAFDYDLETALKRCRQDVTVIATDSSLFELTVKAAKMIPLAKLIHAKEITKPAFEHPVMAEHLRALLLDNSQINSPLQT